MTRFRDYSYCKVSIPKFTLHREIHEYVGDIPTPKPQSAILALETLGRLSREGVIGEWDPIEKRLYVLASLFEKSDPQTAEAFRKQLEIVHKSKSPP